MASTDPFSTVRTGEPFRPRAAAWNKLVELARRDAQGGTRATASGATLREDQSLIRVRNSTGGLMPRWSVVGLGAPVFEPAHGTPDTIPQDYAENLALKGETPAVGTHEGRFAVLVEPLPDGAIGYAVASGMTAAIVNVGDSSHKFAEIPASASPWLRSADAGGAQIIWKEAGTGERFAVLRIGAPSAPAGTTKLVRINSSSGSGPIFSYTVVDCYWDGAAWTAIGGATPFTARNGAEGATDSSTVIGTGTVLPAGLLTTPERRPIRAGIAVTVTLDSAGNWTFSLGNGYAAECAGPGFDGPEEFFGEEP